MTELLSEHEIQEILSRAVMRKVEKKDDWHKESAKAIVAELIFTVMRWKHADKHNGAMPSEIKDMIDDLLDAFEVLEKTFNPTNNETLPPSN